MNELTRTWQNLKTEREKVIWLTAFWYGSEAGKIIKEEVRTLARELDRPEKEI